MQSDRVYRRCRVCLAIFDECHSSSLGIRNFCNRFRHRNCRSLVGDVSPGGPHRRRRLSSAKPNHCCDGWPAMCRGFHDRASRDCPVFQRQLRIHRSPALRSALRTALHRRDRFRRSLCPMPFGAQQIPQHAMPLSPCCMMQAAASAAACADGSRRSQLMCGSNSSPTIPLRPGNAAR